MTLPQTSDLAEDEPCPRAMLVFAHPDDETIALGARLGRLREGVLVHVTDGSPANGQDARTYGFASGEAYRKARQAELGCALAEAGCSAIGRVELGVGDQRAAYELADLSRRLAGLFAEHRPELVVTHPYEGGHPDHDACAFAVWAAVAIAAQGAPVRVEAAFYHLGSQGIETGCFTSPETETELIYVLDEAARERKQRMLACFRTQAATLSYFSSERELFRLAPRYDFAQPPHGGAVFYDGFDWGVRSEEFCRRTVEAARELGLGTGGAACA